MKYILLIGDGMADNPVPELGGKTPLQAADKPFLDSLCEKSLLGSVSNVPAQLPPGSDTAILSIFGCDPNRYFTGRSPLEAAGCGFTVAPGEISYRCNMVALSDGEMPWGERKILSHNAGNIEGESSIALITWLLTDPEFKAGCNAIGLRIEPCSTAAPQRACWLRRPMTTWVNPSALWSCTAAKMPTLCER